MEQMKIMQYFQRTSRSKKISDELVKKVDVNYSIPDTLPGRQDIRSWAGYTSLHFVVETGDLDLVKALLEEGANPVKQGTSDGCTPVHLAFKDKFVYSLCGKLQKCSVIDILLSRQVKMKNSVNPKCDKGVSHLHIACALNHIEAVEFFAKAGIPLDEPAGNEYLLPGYTPLHYAIRYSSIEAADILLRHGADICVKDADGVSCLHLLVQRIMNTNDFMRTGERNPCEPHEEEVKRLQLILKSVLKTRNADDTFLDDTGLSALHVTCTLRNTSLVKEYLERGAVVNLPVKCHSKFWPGWTPLHFAACFDIETVELLMQNDANILMKNYKGETALDLCAKRFTPVNVQSLLSKEKRFENIVLSDNCTKFSDLLISMSDYNKFSDFVNHLKQVNIVIPANSPIWPGFNLLHVSVSLNEKIKFWGYLKEKFDLPKTNSVIKRYNCTEDEEALYGKRIDLCLMCGCSVSQKNASGQTPIHLAFSLLGQTAVKKLLDHSDENVVDLNGLSHLHIACAMGHLDAVKRYLKKGADVNSRVVSSFQHWRNERLIDVRENSTPLHVAVTFGRQAILKELLKFKADVYAQDSLGFTPIHLTMVAGPLLSEAIAKLLFEASPNLRDSVSVIGLSHLHVAAEADNRQAVDQLLLNGAKVDRVIAADAKGFAFLNGCTPLHLASDNTVESLLEAGADVHVKNLNGVSPLQRALREMSYSFADPFIEMVKRAECEVEPCGWTPLHVACGVADYEWAEELLENGADVDARLSDHDEIRTLDGATPLFILLEQASLETYNWALVGMVKLLLKHGADVTIECRGREMTPLCLAHQLIYSHVIDEDDEDIADHDPLYSAADVMLRGHKSYDVNPVNNYGFSHFHFACVRNDDRTATRFLDHGVDVNGAIDPLDHRSQEGEEDIAGFTPLHFAMSSQSSEVARLLLKRGADVNAEDSNGNKPLHIAVKNKYIDFSLIETMLKLGADIHAKNIHDQTPLHCLLVNGGLTLENIEFFLRCGCSLNILGTTGKLRQGIIGLAMLQAPPTEIQPILGRLAQMKEMRIAIENGFSVIQSIVGIYGNGKLMVEDYLNAIQFFISNGYDIDHRDTEGKTALSAAVSFYNSKAVDALLLLGVDINVKKSGITHLLSSKLVGSVDDNDDGCEKIAVVKTLASHVWKLWLVGIEVKKAYLRRFAKVGRKLAFITLLDESCRKELKKANKTEICEGLTVRDFLSELGAVAEYPRMSHPKRSEVDKYFKRGLVLQREFPEFGGVLVYQYRKALARMELRQRANLVLRLICHDVLDDLCLEVILRYFTNNDMKRVIGQFKECI